MSGFRDDDPDDVTLWAGRLRPWPASPATDGVDDDTVRSLRTAPGDGDTAARPAAESDDDTHRSRRVGAAGDGPVLPAVAEPDEQRSPRSRPRDPIGSGSTGAAEPDVAEPDEQTSPRSRPVNRPAGDVGAPGAAEPVDETLRSVDGASGDGARPRSSGAQSSLIAAGPPEGRAAHAPVTLHRESYAPRLDTPVRVSRAASARMPHSGDAAISRPRRASDRARLVLLATAVVAVVALAVVGVILLLG